ncbi:CMD domain protein [Microbacterium sp. NPDC056234]|uniref:CMD domain protein n=1 Tax=Microbacterium sp. NPDC056234 TaxID=3345757 RepID=UPI0035D5A1D2
MTDIVDDLLEVEPGSTLADLRARRPETKGQIQASYDALFTPVDDSEFTVAERLLVAAFAARLGGEDLLAGHFADRALLADAGRAEVVLAEAAAAATTGPYGAFAEAGLQTENTAGPVYRANAARAALGDRLSAALEHTHLLVFRPREAATSDLDALVDAGWSIDGIVTLSQLVSYLAFQQRVVAGLRVLAGQAQA